MDSLAPAVSGRATRRRTKDGDGDCADVPLNIAGMTAHNRHLAEIWRLGEPGGASVPLAKLAVDSVAAVELHCFLQRHWVDGVLRLKHPTTQKVKVTLRGFALYGNTQRPHDSAKQARHTLLFEGHSMFTDLRRYLGGFCLIELAVLQHAKQWCATFPCVSMCFSCIPHPAHTILLFVYAHLTPLI